jgi:SAM-dependent methyltransferase
LEVRGGFVVNRSACLTDLLSPGGIGYIARMATTLTKENREFEVKAWEDVPCPFCESSDFRPHEKFGPNEKYTYVQCRRCDLVYSTPRPKYDADFVTTAYEVYDTESHHLVTGGDLNEGEKALVTKYQITVRQIETQLGRKGKILDIGCATGLFLLAARELGWQVVGIDISQSMTRQATDCFGIKTYCGQYHEIDLSADGPFDAIYCSHVIEHIPNPNEWTQKFGRDLKPDGILCLNVPNQFSLDRVVKRALYRLGFKRPYWAPWRTPDHLYEPHMKPMRYLLEKHAFRVDRFFTYSSKERPEVSWTDRLAHHTWCIGSKLRIFARPLAG